MPTLGFLSPSFLWALPLALVPFLIHFLSRRRRRVVEFSAVSLLLKARRQNVERLRLREILLLILRTLVVLFLVLAVSRPLLEGLGGAALGDHVPTGIVMVLDATMSMQYASRGESLFERSLERARSVLALLGDQDRVTILTTDREVHEISGSGGLLPRDALHHLAGLSATNFHGSLDDCLARAAVLAREMDLPGREVHVFTDLEEGALGDSVFREDESPVPLVFFSERDPEPANRFLEQALLERDEGAQEERWMLKVRVGSSGSGPAVGIFPRLSLDGEPAGMAEVQLSGEEKKTASFPLENVPGPGRKLMVQIDEDGLHADDERYLLTGEEKPAVVQRGSGLGAVGLLEIALDVLAPPDESAGSEGGAKVLVTLSTDREGIRSALEREDGLVVFPDPAGEKPPAWTFLHITGAGERAFDEGSFQKITAPEGPGANLPGFISELAPGLTRLPVMRYVRISPGEKWKEVWRLDLENGDPVLFGGLVGRSRVAVWAIPPVLESSDLYAAPPFIPLLGEVLGFAAGRKAEREILCGEPVTLRLPRTPPGESVTVKHPGGAESLVAVGPDEEITIEDTLAPGFYSVASGRSVLAEFAVNVDTRESLMGEMDEAELEQHLSPADVRAVRSGAGLEESILTRRGGKDITSWLLIAAFVALLAESHISGRIQKE
jgi:hypothetical protein